MELIPLFFTALALGLLGGGHCIGMCGGLMGALTMAIPAQQRRGWPLWRVLLGYNLGRITSYGIARALLGSIGWRIQDLGLGPPLRTLAGLLMIAVGRYPANWWSGLTRLDPPANVGRSAAACLWAVSGLLVARSDPTGASGAWDAEAYRVHGAPTAARHTPPPGHDAGRTLGLAAPRARLQNPGLAQQPEPA